MSHGVSTTLQQTARALYGEETISHAQSRQPAQRCCETGRPVATDPMTGNTICSCQFQTGSQSYHNRVPKLPEQIYGPGYSQIPVSHSGMGQPAFYAMDGVADRRTNAYAAPLASHVPYNPFDQMMASHPYGAFPQGFDFNAARRKNATREITGPLKAWLNAHRKNPYPTKGEKVMLAIITRMTLTQVSTWFANARRRLKKENVYGDDEFESDDKSSKDDSISSQNSATEDDKRPTSDTSGISDISDVDIEVDDVISRRKPTKKCVQRLFSPDIRNDMAIERIPSPEDVKRTAFESIDRDTETKSESLPPLESFSVFKDDLYENKQMYEKNMKYETSTDCNVQKGSSKRKLEETDITIVNPTKKPKIWSISEIIG